MVTFLTAPFSPIVTGEAPRFLSQTTEVVVDSTSFTNFNGDSVNLIIHCDVTGTPTPSVTWFREGKQIDQTFVTGFTLAMNVTENVEASRSGVPHHCIATNRVGTNNSITATVRSLTTFVRYYCKLHDFVHDFSTKRINLHWFTY